MSASYKPLKSSVKFSKKFPRDEREKQPPKTEIELRRNKLIGQCRMYGSWRYEITIDGYRPGRFGFEPVTGEFAGTGFGLRASGFGLQPYKDLSLQRLVALAELARRSGPWLGEVIR